MRHFTKNNTFLISFILLSLFNTDKVFAQKIDVDRGFVERGSSKFKDQIRSSYKRSDQFSIDYKTLRDIVAQSDTTSPITFIIAGIDKNDKESYVWSKLNNNVPIDELNKKQGLIIRYVLQDTTNLNPKAIPTVIYAALGKLCPPPECSPY